MKYINQMEIGEFFFALEKFDKLMAEDVHLKSCPYCGGKLDWANYKRKSRGIEHEAFLTRFSLCCRKEGCRRRVMPESIRFLGSFVYSSVFILLLSYLLNGRADRFNNICRRYKVGRRTLKRWQEFWIRVCPQTRFWKEQKGRVPGFLVLILAFKILF
jgi:hypothetical protein